jgi:hypothetical protein
MLDHSITGPSLPLSGSLAAIALIGLMFFACGMGRPGVIGSQPLTLEALFAQCGLPATCDAPTPWEGGTVVIEARVDPVNIFEKRRYPQLPYEKFKLIDGRGHSVEVWPGAGDNRAIFDKLAARPSDRIVVQGRLAAVKMPTQRTCRIGIKVLIDDPDQIQFQNP